jgi:hypothetical protein
LKAVNEGVTPDPIGQQWTAAVMGHFGKLRIDGGLVDMRKIA